MYRVDFLIGLAMNRSAVSRKRNDALMCFRIRQKGTEIFSLIVSAQLLSRKMRICQSGHARCPREDIRAYVDEKISQSHTQGVEGWGEVKGLGEQPLFCFVLFQQ